MVKHLSLLDWLMAPRLACGSVFAWGVESFRCHGANPWRVRPSKLRTTVGVSRLAGDASFWPAHCWAAIRRFDGTPDCIRGVAGLSPCHGLPLHAGRACADQHQCRCRFSRHRAAPTTPRRGCQPLGLIRRTRCVKDRRARLDRLTRRCCGEHLLHPLPLPLGSPRYRWGWVVLLR